MQWIAVYVSPYFAVGVFVTSSGCKRRYPMRIQFPDAVIFSVTKIEVILVVVRTNSFAVFLVFYEYTEVWLVKPGASSRSFLETFIVHVSGNDARITECFCHRIIIGSEHCAKIVGKHVHKFIGRVLE